MNSNQSSNQGAVNEVCMNDGCHGIRKYVIRHRRMALCGK